MEENENPEQPQFDPSKIEQEKINNEALLAIGKMQISSGETEKNPSRWEVIQIDETFAEVDKNISPEKAWTEYDANRNPYPYPGPNIKPAKESYKIRYLVLGEGVADEKKGEVKGLGFEMRKKDEDPEDTVPYILVPQNNEQSYDIEGGHRITVAPAPNIPYAFLVRREHPNPRDPNKKILVESLVFAKSPEIVNKLFTKLLTQKNQQK